MSIRRARIGLGLAVVVLVASLGLAAESSASAAIHQLPSDGQASYQLGGAYPPEAGTQVVVRDRTSQPVPGRYNICYVNAFQTQPESLNWWRVNRGGLLLRKGGRLVVDAEWSEVLLDTSTPTKRVRLAGVIAPWIRGCAAKGFAAVEFDNLDSFVRSRGRLNPAMNLAFARMLSQVAHARGLAVAQKNAVELSRRAKAVAKFDFAIAEECQRYAECSGYQQVYGNRLIEVEYTDYSAAVFDAACAARGSRISVIRRDRDLRPAGAVGYQSQYC